ncbi:MAG: glycosyltransferase [Cytophagales bacterium]|nr:glycosyltransferase [Cytophagales bacterium]
MVPYFFIIFLLYYIFIGVAYFGWTGIHTSKDVGNIKDLPFISVLVAVRNEEKNIANLLKSLSCQLLPKDKYEVIIINDRSEDKTVKIVREFCDSDKLNVRLLNSDYPDGAPFSPKKYALSLGIERAKGTIIVTTDGDCRSGKNWLRAMVTPFQNIQTMFVSGPVVLDGPSKLFYKLQSIEFASLVGSGGALINLGYPLMCNGANIAFRKSVFEEVRGYEGNMENASGDDVFLMQKIHRTYQRSIVFAKDPDAIVSTSPQKNLKSLIAQRRRWASKWNRHLLHLSWILPLFLFTHYLSMFAAIVLLFVNSNVILEITSLILIKTLFDFIFLKKVMFFCKLRLDTMHFFICELLYPAYAVFFGVISQFGIYQWKGRSHKI